MTTGETITSDVEVRKKIYRRVAVSTIVYLYNPVIILYFPIYHPLSPSLLTAHNFTNCHRCTSYSSCSDSNRHQSDMDQNRINIAVTTETQRCYGVNADQLTTILSRHCIASVQEVIHEARNCQIHQLHDFRLPAYEGGE